MLLASTLLATALTAHAAEAPSTPNHRPSLMSTEIDGMSYTYDFALPRDQRTVNLTITKQEAKGETQVMSANASTLVAMQKYNDHAKLFALPIEVTRTVGYPVKMTVDGHDVAVPQNEEGVSAVVYLSDSASTVGTASVHLKMTSQSLWGGNKSSVDETVDFALNEGVNVKKVGAYTVTLTINPLQTTATATASR